MLKSSEFINLVQSLRFENVFNPYSQQCPIYDRADAPAIRSTNLRTFLEAATTRNSGILWLGRDFGYRGGRRTGLALTDEAHLSVACTRLHTNMITRATKGPIFEERTAGVVWKLLARIRDVPFLWNVFPLHPFHPSTPFSNRCHTSKEFRACHMILTALLELLRPKQVIAIGKDAARAAKALGIHCIAVRHPSYGGQADFINAIRNHYGLQTDNREMPCRYGRERKSENGEQ